ncbi:hypothetical protein ACFC0M_05755 [Streptomyces sp. NPDC056149]|uniref:hypothetical protein n=1 Tax=Streptomyces sp. NPDC056149 TaxID=3345728 RepID=UPI0035E19C1C
MEDPLVAVFPGVWDPWVRVDTHPVTGVGNLPLGIHVTRYPAPNEDVNDHVLPDTLNLHTLATAPLPFRVLERRLEGVRNLDYRRKLEQGNERQDRRAMNGATVVIGRAFDGDPAPLVLDAMMRRYFPATTVGIQIDDETVLVGMRTPHLPGSVGAGEDNAGFTVVMSGDPGAPVALFPSALQGWSRWWRREVGRVRERPVAAVELPEPPTELDLIEAWKEYRIRIGGYERASWPPLPNIPRNDLGDDDC